jgi:hypothetical protein
MNVPIMMTGKSQSNSEIDALFDLLAKMPVHDARAADDIMGYGEDGLLSNTPSPPRGEGGREAGG